MKEIYIYIYILLRKKEEEENSGWFGLSGGKMSRFQCSRVEQWRRLFVSVFVRGKEEPERGGGNVDR